LFFANFAEFLRGLCGQKLLKALNRKARKGIAKDAKKSNCANYPFAEPKLFFL
jgi:hypothetical protein